MKKNLRIIFFISALLLVLGSFTKTSTSPTNSAGGGSNTNTSGTGGTGGGTTSNANTGGISGTVSPATTVCEIDIINVKTGLTVASTATSSKDGSFSFTNLTPAQYNVRATPTPDPNNLGIHTWIGVVVSAGAVSTVGPISLN